MRYACTTCRLLYRSAFHRCPLDAGDIVALAPDDDPLMGATLGGHYQIDELVGDSDAGRIYRACHVELPRRFAVLIPYGEIAAVGATRSRFRKAAQAASRLDHPNVVPVIDVGETEERLLYVVTDDVDGRDLRSIISSDGPLEAERVASLARQLARGLEHAHGRGVRHGDLRPESVLVVEQDGSEIARISGFGLPGVQADVQSDLYRLGLLLYEMMAGCPPFEDEDAFDGVGVAPPPIRQRAPDATPPPAIERVALRLLAADPAVRYRSAAEVLAELEPASAPVESPGTAAAGFDLAIDEPEHPVAAPARRPPPPEYVDEPPVVRRRRSLPLVAGALGIVVAIGSVAFAFLRSRANQAPVASALAAPVADAGPPAPPPVPAAESPAPPPVPAAEPPAPVADASPPALPVAEPPREVAAAPPPARSSTRARAPKTSRARAVEPVRMAEPPPPATEPPPPAAEPPPPAAEPPPPEPATPPASGGEKTAASRQAADKLVREGTRLYLAGRAEEAKKKFLGALLLDSRSAAAHRGLGFAYQKLGDPAKAAQHLQRYLDLAPDARDAEDIRARLRSLGN